MLKHAWSGTSRGAAIPRTYWSRSVAQRPSKGWTLGHKPLIRPKVQVGPSHLGRPSPGFMGRPDRRPDPHARPFVFPDAERRGGHHWVARVVSQPVDYGLGRMLDAYVDDQLGLTLRGFYDIEEARVWLRDPDR